MRHITSVGHRYNLDSIRGYSEVVMSRSTKNVIKDLKAQERAYKRPQSDLPEGFPMIPAWAFKGIVFFLILNLIVTTVIYLKIVHH